MKPIKVLMTMILASAMLGACGEPPVDPAIEVAAKAQKTAYEKEIADWRVADKKTLKKRYGPAEIRLALDKRDGLTKAKRKELYDLMSHVATHATPSGFKLAAKDGLGKIGPFFDEDKFQAWAEEAAKMAGHAGIIFSHAMKKPDRKLRPVKVAYLDKLGAWRLNYVPGGKP